MAPITAVGICHALGVEQPDMKECIKAVKKFPPLEMYFATNCAKEKAPNTCAADVYRTEMGSDLKKQWPLMNDAAKTRYLRFKIITAAQFGEYETAKEGDPVYLPLYSMPLDRPANLFYDPTPTTDGKRDTVLSPGRTEDTPSSDRTAQ
ncbi:MAG: hypothetical protein HYV02_02965 [Deltaproteobacteria bacterium]|nr:hypothetical protein [Deltaproteobacteria bacterium]